MPEWPPRNTKRARELRNQATPAARLSWEYLGERRLLGFKFSRQMPVVPFFADFVCRSVKLIVEIDGYLHDTSVEADASRERRLRNKGYEIIRFTDAEVLSNVEGVVTTIGHVLADRPTPDPFRQRAGGKE